MINFIQIGANVGNTPSDIIWKIVREKQWNGIFIEPLPGPFEELKKNYSDLKDCKFENIAIYNYNGIIEIYHEPDGDTQIASLIKGFSEKRNTLKTKVICLTLETLIDKYNLLDIKFDFLQIDAEKSDSTILLSTDFTRIKPKYIRFEHCHISSDDRWDVLVHLSKFGYKEIHDFYNDLRPTEENNIDTLLERQ